MNKKQVCISLNEEMYNELQKTKKDSGVSISKQIELRLKGYSLKHTN